MASLLTMIIKDKTYLHSIEEDGDLLKFNHVQDISPTLRAAQEIREHSDNGWTHDRSMRQIGLIDELTFQKLLTERPEIAKDGKELYKFIMSPEGAQYRTVTAANTGRSGHVIIK